MIAGPAYYCQAAQQYRQGYAQSGYWRGTGGQIQYFAETNTGGTLNGWSLQAFSETKDYQSDVPGAWGSTGLFSAIGALYDSANDADWQGYVNFNVGQNDNVTRWTKGSINQLDPNSFGWNFQTWTS